MSERIYIVIILGILLVLISIKAISSLPSKSFITPDGRLVTEAVTMGALDDMEKNGRLFPGASAKIGTLNRIDGSSVTFTIAEGTFSKTTIDPAGIWKKIIVQPTLLVSSGDEILRNDGGVSEAIGAGCGVQQLTYKLATGAVLISPCTGPYRDNFPELRSVANTVIEAWHPVDEKPTCNPGYVAQSTHDQDSYIQCIQDAIKTALHRLLISVDIKGANTVIIPELGTGTAGLDKGHYYQSLKDAIEECLIITKGCGEQIPENVILVVWSQDRAGAWAESKSAIARNFGQLSQDWELPFAEGNLSWKYLRYLGILLVLFAFVASPLSNYKTLPIVGSQLSRGSMGLIILGWGIIAAGLSTSDAISDFFSLPSQSAPLVIVVNVAIGILAAMLCGVINRATDAFKG